MNKAPVIHPREVREVLGSSFSTDRLAVPTWPPIASVTTLPGGGRGACGRASCLWRWGRRDGRRTLVRWI